MQATLSGSSQLDEAKFIVRAQELGGLELDFVIRLGHSYGIGSLKSGNLRRRESQAVEEISSEGRYFGPYVGKFLVVTRILSDATNKICKANNVTPIELLSFTEQQRLSDEDRAKLVDTIVAAMQPRKR
ncbi:MAG: hypothetical protein KatS3mg059_1335 [Thermomicrobiales bacterium]|nr:MAG: hypothetical protein KatS3mg059_1335 [Thermomicrobiales bacterium]